MKKKRTKNNLIQEVLILLDDLFGDTKPVRK